MINYNLRTDRHYSTNHPLDCKWAELSSGPWMNHLCTVVDNHNEVVDGRYTQLPSKLLLHMSPRVRCYVHGSVFRDFYYVGIFKDADIPTFTNWDYKFEELSDVQIISDLKTVLYDLEPLLRSKTLVGFSGQSIWDDPNHFYGDYVLNDENSYHIHRKRDNVTFTRDDGTEICTFKLNKDLFEKAVDLDKRRKYIVLNADKLLCEGTLAEYVSSYDSDKNQFNKLCELGGLL